MGHVVDNGRVRTLKPARMPRRAWPDHPVKSYVNGRVKAFGCHTIEQVEANLAIVREHFGTNISDAFRMSLHLVARAIKAGKMTP